MQESVIVSNWPLFLLAVLFGALLLVWAVHYIDGFIKELQYLNSEIRRTRGEERRHWMRQRRRLWLSLIPFVKY